MAQPIYPLSLSKGCTIRAQDTNTYQGEVSADFCYASALALPTGHGGYVASIILAAIECHFKTTLKHLDQPDTFTSHFRYLNASNAGAITIHIANIKLGKSSSTMHFSAKQNGTEKVVGYALNINASPRAREGFTIATEPLLTPAPLPISFADLALGRDAHWICHENPFHPQHTWKSMTQCKYVLPRAGQPGSMVSDGWISPVQPGERFTNLSLGWLADQWPQAVQAYRPELPSNAPEAKSRAVHGLMNTPKGLWGSPMWFPTLTLDIELKKPLPAEGVEWIFVRSRSRQIKDGRMDLEVMVFDQEMDLVAISHHVCFVISLTPKDKAESEKRAGNKL